MNQNQIKNLIEKGHHQVLVLIQGTEGILDEVMIEDQVLKAILILKDKNALQAGNYILLSLVGKSRK